MFDAVDPRKLVDGGLVSLDLSNSVNDPLLPCESNLELSKHFSVPCHVILNHRRIFGIIFIHILL